MVASQKGSAFIFLLVAFALALGLGVAGCGGGDTTAVTTSAQTGGTIGDASSQLAPPKSGGNVVETQLPVFAGDPSASKQPKGQSVLDQLPQVQRPTGATPVPNIRGSAGQTVAQWLSTVDNDVASFWQGAFNRAGYRYIPAKQVLFSTQPISTGCGSASFDNGPFYCSGRRLPKGAIYLPIPWFNRYRTADTAIAVVVAHENGHRVQDLLGAFKNRRSLSIELQADCLAGYWAASVYQRGLLQRGDLQEAFRITRQSGDPPGTPKRVAHGTSQQRLAAFKQGYDSGRAGNCGI